MKFSKLKRFAVIETIITKVRASQMRILIKVRKGMQHEIKGVMSLIEILFAKMPLMRSFEFYLKK